MMHVTFAWDDPLLWLIAAGAFVAWAIFGPDTAVGGSCDPDDAGDSGGGDGGGGD